MAGYLIAEEGPLAGIVITFEEGEEWILGRDPDEATIVLEDPMVSRKHVICRLTSEGYILENLSSVNPSTQNGKVITEAVLLKEGDILQIGSTFFRFTEKDPVVQEPEGEESPLLFEEGDSLSSLSFEVPATTRWLLKVISGPNAGAEFSLQKTSSYILGKDPNLCDVVFHDLSVSRQHARILVDEEDKVFIEDLGSRNGVLVNGELVTEKKPVLSQDLIALGTTSFLIIDREQIHETIISPPSFVSPKMEEAPPLEEPSEPVPAAAATEKSWKDLIIPTKHIILAGTFFILVLGLVTATFSLFKAEPVVVQVKHESELVADALKPYPAVQFTFNESSGKLFLVGHVLTTVEKQELTYTISNLSFVQSVEDNVVIDELVWQNMNALILANPDWQAVSIHSPTPGKFVMRGYVQTIDQAQALADYINSNFPYLDLLDNQVVVENNLNMQIQGLLLEKGFSAVVFQLANGELVLTGRVDDKDSSTFTSLISEFKTFPGIRQVKNFVVFTSAETSRVDISQQYQVTGFSQGDDNHQYVVINGRVFATGDLLDGMQITAIQPNIILLEKDGIKFRINYNLQ
jgi:type III secretion system YscD/HrpQ family protein